MANIERLTKLAEALEKPLPKKVRKSGARYNQTLFHHQCGTPACALGYYAHVSEGRFGFAKQGRGKRALYQFIYYGDSNVYGGYGSVRSGAVKEFDLKAYEVDELFSDRGCGGARNRKEAAAYVRDFIARKEAEADGAL